MDVLSFHNFFFFSTGILSSFNCVLLWAALAASIALLPVLPKPWGILFSLVFLILRAIYTMGLGPALLLLGTVNVSGQRLESSFTIFFSMFFLVHSYSCSTS